MSSTQRHWKLTVNCHTSDEGQEYVAYTHDIESTGQPSPMPFGQFLNWSGSGRVISYNSNNVHSWYMEEISPND
jgi:hypothetical protein